MKCRVLCTDGEEPRVFAEDAGRDAATRREGLFEVGEVPFLSIDGARLPGSLDADLVISSGNNVVEIDRRNSSHSKGYDL